MFTFRDVVVFFAGAEFFHTISHIILGYVLHLPMHVGILWTHHLNTVAVVVNAAITIVLIWWSMRLKEAPHRKKK